MVTTDFINNMSTFASNIMATTIVYPLDTIRIRKQLDEEPLYNRKALYKAYPAGILRQITYSSPNLIFFRKLNEQYKKKHGEQEPTLMMKTFFGSLSGATAGLLGNPAEAIMVRSIKDSQYQNIFHSIRTIYAQNQWKGFFNGVVPMSLRCGVYNAGRLPIYSETKNYIQQHYPSQKGSVLSHSIAAFSGSFVGIIASNPLDVIKSRMQGNTQKRSIQEIIAEILQKDGMQGFYRGLMASFFKSGPHSIFSFIFAEQLSLLLTGKEMF